MLPLDLQVQTLSQGICVADFLASNWIQGGLILFTRVTLEYFITNQKGGEENDR